MDSCDGKQQQRQSRKSSDGLLWGQQQGQLKAWAGIEPTSSDHAVLDSFGNFVKGPSLWNNDKWLCTLHMYDFMYKFHGYQPNKPRRAGEGVAVWRNFLDGLCLAYSFHSHFWIAWFGLEASARRSWTFAKLPTALGFVLLCFEVQNLWASWFDLVVLFVKCRFSENVKFCAWLRVHGFWGAQSLEKTFSK